MATKKSQQKKAKKVAKASKKSPAKKTVKKVTSKVDKPAKISAKAEKPVLKNGKVVPVKLTEKAKKLEEGVKRLLSKGKEKGFVTYDAILKEFPNVEEDLDFLDSLYSRLSEAKIDVLESGGLLDISLDENIKKIAAGESSSGYDSIQMYLKEIG